jgi:hypothetical protein
MISISLLNTTVLERDNTEWMTTNFKNFLVELNHIKDSLGEACLYRGHRRIDWLLDSTFSRSLKQMLKLSVTRQYPEQALDDIELQHYLAGLWLQKVDAVQLNPDLLKMEPQGIDPYFEYHRHHQQNPDDEYINDVDPKGTNFVDFSYDWRVGLYFANCKRDEKDEGVLFIVRQTVLGPVLLTKPFSHTIEALRKALALSPEKIYNGLPLMVYPEGQMNNSLDPKPKRQDAVYIAQMDFRFDLGLSWELRQLTTGKQVFLKLILPAGTQDEVTAFLEEQGITPDYLFPPTIFDKRSVNF